MILIILVFLPILLIIIGFIIKKENKRKSKTLITIGVVVAVLYLVGFGVCLSSI